MENNLPKGWEEVELSFLVDYKKGKKPKRMENKPFDNSLVYLDIRAIEKKNDEIFVDAETSNATDEDELVIVWDGARAGWVGKSRKGALGSTLMGLKPKIDRDYLYRFIQTQFDYLQTNHRGTGIPHVDPDIFWNIKVPVAPEKEQQRIVAKVDELMERIDRSRTRLENIRKILKRFRQSILAAAVSGKLTEEWRDKNPNTLSAKLLIDELTQIRRAKNPKVKLNSSQIESDTDIPEKWSWTQLLNIAEVIGGVTKGKKFNGRKTIYLPYLRVANVQDGYLDLSEVKTIEVLPEDLEKYKLAKGDILFTEGGDRDKLGRGTIWNNEVENCIHQNHIFRARAFENYVLPGYISIYAKSENARAYFFENASQTVNLASINLTTLANVPIAVPPLKEQQEIVRRVEQLFSLADKIESRYNTAKAQVDRLPQSLLAKAFSGELVPQDESDEPASLLLARINDKLTPRSVKKAKTKEYQIEPPASIGIAAESKPKYAEPVSVKIPESKRAFAKQVMGGKIVSLFKDDPHFTHIKFQKLQYLAEHLAEVDLNWNYYRQSAGPYDPKFMHTVAFKLKASKWFEEKKYKFHPLEKVDKIEGYYESYFKPVAAKLNLLFSALKQSTEDEAEIVATLYAVWNNMIIKKEHINDDVIVSTFFEWSDRKKKYTRPQVAKTLAWMKKNGFAPTGFGKVIKERKK